MQTKSPRAAELLTMCAFFAPEAIPEELLIRSATEPGSQLGTSIANQFQFNAILRELLACSLLHRNAQTKTVAIHPVLQAVLRSTMSEDQHQVWIERTMRTLDLFWPMDAMTEEDWLWRERLLPHVVECLKLSECWKKALPYISALRAKIAAYLKNQESDSKTESLYFIAHSCCVHSLSPLQVTME